MGREGGLKVKMEEETKLKPCPFCGCKWTRVNKTILGGYYADCFECNAETKICKTEAEAAALWNMRKESEE